MSKYICNCGLSFEHEYDRLIHAADCNVLKDLKLQEYDRMNPSLEMLLKRLSEYSKITYGTRAYQLSGAESGVIVKSKMKQKTTAEKQRDFLIKAMQDFAIGVHPFPEKIKLFGKCYKPLFWPKMKWPEYSKSLSVSAKQCLAHVEHIGRFKQKSIKRKKPRGIRENESI